MNERPDTRLDHFETALLTELNAELSRQADARTGDSAPAPLPVRELRPVRTRRPSRPAWLALAAAAVVAVVTLTQIPGLGSMPAYAVTGRNDGEVKVRVNRLEGADGLERALAERGITADITYLPARKECAPGRYVDRRTPGMVLGVAQTYFEVTIPPDSVGPDDTFVLSASVMPIPNGLQSTTDFGIAQGPVAPCRVIDSP